MKPLLLMIISLALTPTAYAEKSEEEGYVYWYCDGERFVKGECRNIKKGETLYKIDARNALIYCNHNSPILRGKDPALYDEKDAARYTCFYNGKLRKKLRSL